MNWSATPNFIPSREELKLERDLRLHPSTKECRVALTPVQMQLFNRDGYVSGIRFDELLARTLAGGPHELLESAPRTSAMRAFKTS
jgi:DNA-binding Xre family transcriptional regulator